jgi:hypothetical protein
MAKGFSSFVGAILLCLGLVLEANSAHAQGGIVIIGPGGGGGGIFVPQCSTPTNDSFSNPQILSGDFLTLTGEIRCGSVEPDEPAYNGADPSQSVWYRWRSDRIGLVSFRAHESFIRPLPDISVYIGSSITSLVSVPLTNGQFKTSPGQEYCFRVSLGPGAWTGEWRYLTTFYLQFSFETLKLITAVQSPLAGQTQTFEFTPTDSNDVLSEVSVLGWRSFGREINGALRFRNFQSDQSIHKNFSHCANHFRNNAQFFLRTDRFSPTK